MSNIYRFLTYHLWRQNSSAEIGEVNLPSGLINMSMQTFARLHEKASETCQLFFEDLLVLNTSSALFKADAVPRDLFKYVIYTSPKSSLATETGGY